MNERLMHVAENKMWAAEQIRRALAKAPPEVSARIEEHLDEVFFDASQAVKTARDADPDEEG